MTQRLLLLCQANIARSAAAGLLAERLLDGRWTVSSAGVHALVGRPVDPVIGDALRRRGIPISDHRGRQATLRDVRDADLILAFERRHRTWVIDQVPTAMHKTLTVRRAAEIATHSPQRALTSMFNDTQAYTKADDFADPFGRGEDVAEAAVNEIDDLLRVILPAIGAADARRMPPKPTQLPTRRSMRDSLVGTR